MNCTNCGAAMPDGAKFCPMCGTRAPEPAKKKFCTTCGSPIESGALFCEVCGTKVETPAPAPAPQPPLPKPPAPTPAPAPAPVRPTPTGRLVSTLKMVSLYDGEPTLGIAKASGELNAYDNRIEFKKQMGNALGSTFGLVGMMAARSSALKDGQLMTIPVGDIAEVHVGKYGALYNTLVVTKRDGTKMTFCPPAPSSSAPQIIVEALVPYL